MIYRNYEIEINDYTSKIYYVKEIQYYQNDINTCRLLVNVYDKSNRCDLTNTTIRLCVQLPIKDATTGKPITFQQQYGINIIDTTKGIFEIILDNELIKNVGRHIADIQIYDTTNQTIRFSNRIEYNIIKSTFDEATAQTTNEFSLLQDLVKQCQDALKKLGDIANVDFDALMKQIEEIKKAIEGLGDLTTLVNKVDKNTTDITTINTQLTGMLSDLSIIKTNYVSKAYIDGELLKKANSSDVWNPTNKAILESTQQAFTTMLKTKLDGIQDGATNYAHPNDTNTRHVTDTQIVSWDAKADRILLDNKADVIHSQGAGSVLFTDGQSLQYKYNNGQLGGGGGTPPTPSTDLTQVNTNILPILPNLNIGSPTQRFKNIYVDEAHLSTNTLYIGNTPVMGTENGNIAIKADPNQSVKVVTDGNATTDIASNGVAGKVNIYGTSQVNIHSTDINMTGNTNVDNLTVKGNINVQGTTTTVNSTNMTIKDNIIEINAGQTGQGVSLGQAGIKIDRGDLADVFLVFDEGTDTLKFGTQTTQDTVAMTKDIPDVSGKADKNYVDTQLGLKADASTMTTQLENKVDKIIGKGLSAEDFTNAYKTKLDGISVSAKKVESSTINGNVKIDGVETKVYAHPSTHSVGEVTGLSTVATSGSYVDLSNKPIIPNRTSQLTNDSGFITDISGKVDKTQIKNTLTETVVGNVLDSTQGKILDDKITVLSGQVLAKDTPSSNANDLIIQGVYRVYGGVTNAPLGNAGIIHVVNWDNSYIYQRYSDITNLGTWERWKVNGTWQPWKQLATTEIVDIPNANCANGWVNTTWCPLVATVSGNAVNLSGMLTGGTATDATVMCTLPLNIPRPKVNKSFWIYTYNDGTKVRIVVNTNGTITVSGTAQTYPNWMLNIGW